MHVDGFRFDLAAAPAREFHDADRLAAFFDLVQQDPVVSQLKLIAEPWEVGAGGYQIANFPPLWTEWNGRCRDAVRDLWRGTPGTVGELASRSTGSRDLYESSGRRPYASVDFVTGHDGSTLHDLVSYERKYNEGQRDLLGRLEPGRTVRRADLVRRPPEQVASRALRLPAVPVLQGRPVRGTDLEDIASLTPDGRPVTDEEWTAGHASALTVFLIGSGIPEPDRRGRRIRDDSLLLLVNPGAAERIFTLPGAGYGLTWVTELDTAEQGAGSGAEHERGPAEQWARATSWLSPSTPCASSGCT